MKLKTKLKKLKLSNELENYVIDYILDDYKTDDEIKCFFSDLLNNGCQSGMISTLIYYRDTKKFYIKFMDEIHELIEELESSMGETIKAKGTRSNFYAWLAFEETARSLSNEIGLDF
jgi:hypothetical protein